MADWVLLPLKRMAEAKSRLSVAFGPADRQALMRAMVADVITACRSARRVDRIGVITSDPAWKAVASGLGCAIFDELIALGYSAGAELGCALLERDGTARHVAVLPGDLPLIRPQEVDTVMAALAEGARCVIVPSRDGAGTNCMAQPLPLSVPLRYGPNSFERHRALAGAAGVAATVLHLPGIGHDVDRPEDLDELEWQAAGPWTELELRRLFATTRHRQSRRSA